MPYALLLVSLALTLVIIHPDPEGGADAPAVAQAPRDPGWPPACQVPLRIAAVAPDPAIGPDRAASSGPAPGSAAASVAGKHDRAPGVTGGAPSGHRAREARPSLPFEWVAVVNPSPILVELSGWTLRASSGRRGRLPPLSLPPGATQVLPLARGRGLRLSDGGGDLALIDPCGFVRDRVRWPAAEAGQVFLRPDELLQTPRPDPARGAPPAPAGVPEARALRPGLAVARSHIGAAILLLGPQIGWVDAAKGRSSYFEGASQRPPRSAWHPRPETLARRLGPDGVETLGASVVVEVVAVDGLEPST